MSNKSRVGNPGAASGKSAQSAGGAVGLQVRHRRRRPDNAVIADRPNAAQLHAARLGQSEIGDDLFVRRLYDVNKELAEYIRDRLTIKIGRQIR